MLRFGYNRRTLSAGRVRDQLRDLMFELANLLDGAGRAVGDRRWNDLGDAIRDGAQRLRVAPLGYSEHPRDDEPGGGAGGGTE